MSMLKGIDKKKKGLKIDQMDHFFFCKFIRLS